MLTGILFGILIIPVTLIVTILQGITSVFSTIVPDQVYNSIPTLISYLSYFEGIFPIDTLLFCVYSLAVFYIAYYTVKIILWAWGLVPFLGSSNITLPQTDNHKSSSQTRILTDHHKIRNVLRNRQ